MQEKEVGGKEGGLLGLGGLSSSLDLILILAGVLDFLAGRSWYVTEAPSAMYWKSNNQMFVCKLDDKDLPALRIAPEKVSLARSTRK